MLKANDQSKEVPSHILVKTIKSEIYLKKMSGTKDIDFFLAKRKRRMSPSHR